MKKLLSFVLLLGLIGLLAVSCEEEKGITTLTDRICKISLNPRLSPYETLPAEGCELSFVAYYTQDSRLYNKGLSDNYIVEPDDNSKDHFSVERTPIDAISARYTVKAPKNTLNEARIFTLTIYDKKDCDKYDVDYACAAVVFIQEAAK